MKTTCSGCGKSVNVTTVTLRKRIEKAGSLENYKATYKCRSCRKGSTTEEAPSEPTGPSYGE